MPQKKPRPPKNPKNFPNLPLIQNDEPDEMSNDRWRINATDDGAEVIYSPSDHHKYLEQQGRAWLTDEAMNPEVREEIEKRLVEKFWEHLDTE